MTSEEANHALAELMEDSRVGPGTSLLIDARGATRALSLGELAIVAYHFRTLYGLGVTRLAVVTDDAVIEAAAKAFAALITAVGASARTFRDSALAAEWLTAARS